MPNQREQTSREGSFDGKDFSPMPSSGEGKRKMGAGAAEPGKSLTEQAKSTAGESYDAVAKKATSTLEEKKAGLSGGLTSMAQTLRTAGDSLKRTENQNYMTEYSARYAQSAAEKLEQTVHYFESNDFEAMARDAKDFARRNPVVFLGGAFALGMLAARFLKSTPMSERNSEKSAIPTGHQLESGLQSSQQSQARGI